MSIGPVKREYLAKMAPAATQFMNFKKRVIFRTKQGAYIIKTDTGPSYNPKAKFYKNPAGSTVSTKYVKNLAHIPIAIRPKFDRKARKNAGQARGQYAARAGGTRVLPMKRRPYITELEEGYKPKRPAGRPRKHLVSPKPAYGLAGLFKSLGMGPVKRRYMATRARKARKARKTA